MMKEGQKWHVFYLPIKPHGKRIARDAPVVFSFYAGDGGFYVSGGALGHHLTVGRKSREAREK